MTTHLKQSVCTILHLLIWNSPNQVFFPSCHNIRLTHRVSMCVSCRAPGANDSVTCYKLTSLLPWTPSVEKYKWATKRGERQREKARQNERGRWRWGGGQGSLCMNIKVFLLLPLPDMWSLLSPQSNEDIWRVRECVYVWLKIQREGVERLEVIGSWKHGYSWRQRTIFCI